MNPQPNPMLDMLAQLSADKPELQPMLEMLRAQQHTYAEEVPADDGPTREELLLQNEQLIALLRRARHEIKRLDATIGALRQDADEAGHFQTELAAALGACPQCWGTDHACNRCHGRGGPGAYPPDQPLYARYVRRAARRQAGPPRLPEPAGARPAAASDSK